jgi:hypothetical protein
VYVDYGECHAIKQKVRELLTPSHSTPGTVR